MHQFKIFTWFIDEGKKHPFLCYMEEMKETIKTATFELKDDIICIIVAYESHAYNSTQQALILQLEHVRVGLS